MSRVHGDHLRRTEPTLSADASRVNTRERPSRAWADLFVALLLAFFLASCGPEGAAEASRADPGEASHRRESNAPTASAAAPVGLPGVAEPEPTRVWLPSTVAAAGAARCEGTVTHMIASPSTPSEVRVAHGSAGGVVVWIEDDVLHVQPLGSDGRARGDARTHPMPGVARLLGLTATTRGFLVAVVARRGRPMLLAVDHAGVSAADVLEVRPGYDLRAVGEATRWQVYGVADDIVLVQTAAIWFWVHRFTLRDGQLVRTELRQSTTATERETDAIDGSLAATHEGAIAVLLHARLSHGERFPILSLKERALVLARPPVTRAMVLETDRVLLLQETDRTLEVRVAAERRGGRWRVSDEVAPVPDPARLPPPFDAPLDVELRHPRESGALELVRRRASGVEVGEPFVVARLDAAHGTRLAALADWSWTGDGFVVAWVSRGEDEWSVHTRAVQCE